MINLNFILNRKSISANNFFCGIATYKGDCVSRECSTEWHVTSDDLNEIFVRTSQYTRTCVTEYTQTASEKSVYFTFEIVKNWEQYNNVGAIVKYTTW